MAPWPALRTGRPFIAARRDLMKIISFNINGIRARPHQLKEIVERHQPEIIGLQETKVQDSEFPAEMATALGYQVHFHGQKGHYGVALLSRRKPLEVQLGLPLDGEEAQRRLITARFDIGGDAPLTVINGYFPQGESRDHPVKFPAKRKFYADLIAHLDASHHPDHPLVVMGDFNISPQDIDIGIGEDNARRWLRTGKCSFLPEEREWYQALCAFGLDDTYRRLHGERDDLYSWFDYRSRAFEREPRRGLRIDHVLATVPLAQGCADAGIDYDIRAMDKPSDHCPVWAEFAV